MKTSFSKRRWTTSSKPESASGRPDCENYRDLLTRLSTALAMTEAAYLEARHRRDL
jgi:hypothetical protein